MTSLQKQLAAIAASSTHQLDLKAQKVAHAKSLLFEPRVAASQSFDSIYLICAEGYRDLCALDPRFLPFARTLFSEQSKAEDRTQMNKKENKELDAVIEPFLTLVGPRLLLKPAEKALEWLVRRFRVHEYNTECLVLTYLPYHASPQFLALLSVLPPSPPPTLRFLFPYISPPATLPRTAIVYTATNTPAFFSALQSYVVKVLQAGHQGPSLLSFWSGVTTQATDAVLEQSQSGRRDVQDERQEQLLLRVFPALNECLKLSDVSEAVMGCYMIVIVLATKGVFEDKILDSLMEAVVRSQRPETLDACIMCLAIIAEERSQPRLPDKVNRRLLRIPDLAQSLTSLSTRCRIERLALGCALGAVDTLGQSGRSMDALNTFENIIKARLLGSTLLQTVLLHLLRLARITKPGSETHGELINLLTELNDSTYAADFLRNIAREHNEDFEFLGLSLDQDSAHMEDIELPDSDDDMIDADQIADPSNGGPVLPQLEVSASSFLEQGASESFASALTALEASLASRIRVDQFLESGELGRSEAFDKPLFLSFLARAWCGNTSTSAKVTAIHSSNRVMNEIPSGVDLQHLIPYLVCALSDSSATVRRAAATCVSTISKQAAPSSKDGRHHIWGSSNLYGDRSGDLASLSKGQTASILASVVVPVLEECVMDSSVITTSIRNVLEGAHSSKNQSGHSLKAPVRSSFALFLGSHVAATPLLGVRLRLLPLFKFKGKASSGVRTHSILPTIRAWCSLATEEAARVCSSEGLEIPDADKAHMSALLAREPESIELLRATLSGVVKYDRMELREAAFDRVVSIWPSMKSESRLLLGQCLLDLALRNESITIVDRVSKTRALEALRTLKLDTAVLAAFLESVLSTHQMPEGPPAKKRRRSSKNELMRADFQGSGELTKQLRRLTLVLELLEGSNAGEHTALFKNLFSILGDLQQLKVQSGSELVYLQSLILGSLTPIVKQLKDRNDSSEYEAYVRADLLIDCIRHSSSPQVQNSALLLIASLASWVPELVLHNLMPIFTFIGSTLLRQNDEYSAHVVDQTISKVVPQLAASLRAKHRDFLVGVADLLLSFTAAFEHIPNHRRHRLFFELAQTLGPEDSLSAITALLADRYPGSSAQRKFIPELLLRFEPAVTLQTLKGYLALVIDATSAKRKVSDTLFSLNEKQPAQVETAINNLLSGLADLATDNSLRKHIAKAFHPNRDPATSREIFGGVVENIIHLSRKLEDKARLYKSCNRVFANCLDALPTPDLVASSSGLLAKSDEHVQVAVMKAVELRAGSSLHHDQRSVEQMLDFLPQVDRLLQKSGDINVKKLAVSCIDQIVEQFGKKNTAIVATAANTISGPRALSDANDEVRILSLLCLTSMVDVLEEEAISLLPTVLPTSFKYLKESINQEKPSLHNAVFSLLSNIVERLAFMFSREYMVPSLELSQQSAAADGLDATCDASRQQFQESVARHLSAQETFAAIKVTWCSAVTNGFEAAREQLNLIASTIENQPKSKMIKASPTLFSLLLEAFDIRSAVAASTGEETIDEDEIEQLESILIEAVISMTLKLNDTTFRPFFAQLVDQTSSSSRQDASRSITYYKFLAAFFERFKSIVTSYSSYILEHAATLLQTLSKPRSSKSNTASSTDLNIALLAALTASFTYDQDSFWQSPSHYTTIMPPLLSHLTIPPPSSPSPFTTSSYIPTHVLPAITALAAATSSPDNHRALNSILLKYMRSEAAYTRLAAVLCEQALTTKLGEEWLALLPEMLPFVSELREDDDEGVERETQRWIGAMEGILGEDLEGMLQ
ncbi:U3 small nucleolar RNA-associated protein 10 [Lophiostoma macrostomum CBS 122681]|uniref:U3 small nucleolar RNA-associated protein 10 n=1 Tax=Lophiostoma macrostomum CBS 122681 TaxID=1314788 RepID=A0A6A6SUA5_9PLEO|nr:U3 small nucleolar RNA-associated protein 10 [Lophiostoma macrostomum CBS 122681]